MSESNCGFGGNPKYCVDCQKELTAKELEHGLEGFGHQERCCDCYDRRQGRDPSVDKPDKVYQGESAGSPGEVPKGDGREEG